MTGVEQGPYLHRQHLYSVALDSPVLSSVQGILLALLGLAWPAPITAQALSCLVSSPLRLASHHASLGMVIG